MDYQKALIRVEEEREFVQKYLDNLATQIIILKNTFSKLYRLRSETSTSWERTIYDLKIKRTERVLNSSLISQAHAINELEELKRIGTMWLAAFHKESAL